MTIAAAGGATAATSQSAFVPAPHRKPPDLENHGWQPKPLRILAFVPTGYLHQAALADFPFAIAQSQWLSRIELAYGIPTTPATIAHGYVVDNMPTLPGQDATTQSVFDTWLAGEFTAHSLKQAPGYQTIVIIFDHCTAPQSLDGYGCVSHHPGLSDGTGSYALSLGNPTGTPTAQLQSLTATASHEVAESITDFGGGLPLDGGRQGSSLAGIDGERVRRAARPARASECEPIHRGRGRRQRRDRRHAGRFAVVRELPAARLRSPCPV